MKTFICFFSIIIVCSGCRSYSYIEDYQLESTSALLPKLSVITDQEIFSNESDHFDSSSSYLKSIGSYGNLHLVERQFTKYVLEEITSSRTEQKGYAVLRINHMKVQNQLSLLSVMAVVSLGLTTVVGIPAGKYNVELDLSMEVLDKDQNILGIYNGKGRQKAIISMYYGYGEKSAKDKCIYEALEQCFDQISERITRDFDYLESKLNK